MTVESHPISTKSKDGRLRQFDRNLSFESNAPYGAFDVLGIGNFEKATHTDIIHISVYTEMAIGDLPTDSPTSRNLSHVRKAAERARDLVNQILVFSRHRREQL